VFLRQGYLGFMGENLVKPELQKRVMDNNGGLVSSRTVRHTPLGRC
jgi:hypothetical protein